MQDEDYSYLLNPVIDVIRKKMTDETLEMFEHVPSHSWKRMIDDIFAWKDT